MSCDHVVLLSGGLDSMVLAHHLATAGKKIRLLYVNCEKMPSDMEIGFVKRTSLRLNAPLEIVDLSGIVRMELGYLSDEEIQGDELDVGGDGGGTQPIAGFPIVLGTATHYADLVEASDVSVAIIKEQAVARPKLKEFFEEWSGMVSKMLSGKGESYDVPTVSAPFIDKTKAEVIRLGFEMKLPLEESWTCHRSGPIHYGVCRGCKERRTAFQTSELEDPTPYLH
jgi:7-cyano-7-deazaguanine synthase